jgi:hypothetical protein
MSDPVNQNSDEKIFYTYTEHGVNGTGQPNYDFRKAVPSKYLIINGSRVVDPYPHGSDRKIYSRINADGSIDMTSEFRNGGNYLIVPANAGLGEMAVAISQVDAAIALGTAFEPIGGGLATGSAAMIGDFRPGGSEDWQRGFKWGVPTGEIDPAFKDSTSWELGFFTELTTIPNVVAEIGGGGLNIGEYLRNRYFGSNDHDFPAGKYGLNKADSENFDIGVLSAKSLAESGFFDIYKAIFEPGKELPLSIAPRGRFVMPQKKSDISAGMIQETENFVRYIQSIKPESLVEAAVLKEEYGIFNSNMQQANITDDGIILKVSRHKKGVSTRDELDNKNLHDQFLSTNIKKSLAPGGTGFHTRFRALTSVVMQSDVLGSIETSPTTKPLLRGKSAYAPTGMRRPLSTETYFGADGKVVRGEPSEWDKDFITRDEFGGLLEDYLNRQARLPPRGATGFDPRLSPAWAGLKLPN